MKVLNIGSLNLDHVYHVDHILTAGETEAGTDLRHFLGGKGMNQSTALAKAGVEVYHGGRIGADGQPFLDACREYGIHQDYIEQIPGESGHTIIQIDRHGQNSILLFGGANRKLTREYVDATLSHFEKGDILLLQNEVNLLAYLVDAAFEKGMQIALNPSPFDENLRDVDMGKVAIFLVNEVEGGQITGLEEPEAILDRMGALFPHARIVLTLGGDGALYRDESQRLRQPAFPVEAVDTTAAGDTFTGYFLAGLAAGLPMEDVLRMSAKASSIAVTRPGAAPSIPYRDEVLAALGQR